MSMEGIRPRIEQTWLLEQVEGTGAEQQEIPSSSVSGNGEEQYLSEESNQEQEHISCETRTPEEEEATPTGS